MGDRRKEQEFNIVFYKVVFYDIDFVYVQIRASGQAGEVFLGSGCLQQLT
jgi:hypothetical protein